MEPVGTSPLERQIEEGLFEIAPGIYRIPLPTTFAVGDVNTFFLDAARPTLIDTGVMGEDGLTALDNALKPLGRTVTSLQNVLLTHAHVDHSGNIAAIRERSGCHVRVLARGIARLEDVEGSYQQNIRPFLDFLRRCGFGTDTLNKYAEMVRIFTHSARSCPGLEPLRDGEVLDLGERSLEVLWRPGHSSVDTLFFFRDEGIVFTGDHVLPHITPNPTLEAPEPEDHGYFPALIRFRESLALTARMDVKVACPGHGSPFTHLARRCDEMLVHQDRRCRRILKLIREGGPMTRKDLSLALFGKVRLWDIFLTLSEVQAAVELLEAEGSIRTWSDGSVDRLEAIPVAAG